MKYFPASNSSREVRDLLLGACMHLGVKIQCKTSMEALSRLPGVTQTTSLNCVPVIPTRPASPPYGRACTSHSGE